MISLVLSLENILTTVVDSWSLKYFVAPRPSQRALCEQIALGKREALPRPCDV
jgi:hypothetical protein